MKKLLATVCFIALICSLSSCSYIKEEDAKVFVHEYLALLEEENYEEIELMSDFYEDDIVSGFEELEKQTNLDFQSGIEIVEYTGFKSRHSDSYYGVPLCSLTMKVSIGGTAALMEIQVIDEDGVYKTCDVYFTINDELFGIS
ncbi:MAG: hypothetical protein IJ386_06570 [Clostridia bacterium]|nr:hypothetical protein [Clostridia bacterium]